MIKEELLEYFRETTYQNDDLLFATDDELYRMRERGIMAYQQ